MNIDFNIETEDGVQVSITTELTDAEREVVMASLLPVIALMVEEQRLNLTGEDEPGEDKASRFYDGYIPN